MENEDGALAYLENLDDIFNEYYKSGNWRPLFGSLYHLVNVPNVELIRVLSDELLKKVFDRIISGINILSDKKFVINMFICNEFLLIFVIIFEDAQIQ